MRATWQMLLGDCIASMRSLPDGCVQTCITSPPYYGLRDYGTATWEGGDPACDHARGRGGNLANSPASTRGGAGQVEEAQTVPFRGDCGKCGARRIDQQIGLEESPQEYVARLVEVFREVRRVLRDDGTLWLNLGDSYCATDKWGGGVSGNTGKHTVHGDDVPSWAVRKRRSYDGVKPKDLLGIPWMVAFALRDDGWYLRSEIVWAKPNPMPESVTDRPTKAHEQVFLLAKNARYFYDADAVAEASNPASVEHGKKYGGMPSVNPKMRGFRDRNDIERAASTHCGVAPGRATRNKRTVWTVATQPFSGAHFAVFPPKLIEPMVLAGSAEGDTVLDPFAGSGTTGMVALRHGRSFIGCELNREYVELARRRIVDDAPLLNQMAEVVPGV